MAGTPLNQSNDFFKAVLNRRLSFIPSMNSKKSRIVIVMGMLGDFDSFEYAQVLSNEIPRIISSNVELIVVAIGSESAKSQFCSFTSFPEEYLYIVENSELHDELALYKGIRTPFGQLVDLILMCMGFGSQGTLKEVYKGYLGSKKSKQIFNSDELIELPVIPEFKGSVFDRAGGKGFQRPFEMATRRLLNMVEVISNWNTYFPEHNHLTQRGATFILNKENDMLYSFISKGLLGYSENMTSPLDFLNKFVD